MYGKSIYPTNMDVSQKEILGISQKEMEEMKQIYHVVYKRALSQFSGGDEEGTFFTTSLTKLSQWMTQPEEKFEYIYAFTYPQGKRILKTEITTIEENNDQA